MPASASLSRRYPWRSASSHRCESRAQGRRSRLTHLCPEALRLNAPWIESFSTSSISAHDGACRRWRWPSVLRAANQLSWAEKATNENPLPCPGSVTNSRSVDKWNHYDVLLSGLIIPVCGSGSSLSAFHSFIHPPDSPPAQDGLSGDGSRCCDWWGRAMR